MGHVMICRKPSRSRHAKSEHEFDLRPLVEAVTRRAEQQGFILPRQVREELAKAGASEDQWKAVLKSAGPRLVYQSGRYYFVPAQSAVREQRQSHELQIQQAVQALVTKYKQTAEQEDRRAADRLVFLQPVQLLTTDNEHHQVLTKDISTTGIRLLGSRDLLGQKLRLTVPAPKGSFTFLVRIVWTCRIADDLFENGGVFLELLESGVSTATARRNGS